MDPAIWGKGLWYYIFLVLYNVEDLEECKIILDAICRNLPCSDCREHISENIRVNNIMSCSDRNRIIDFFIAVHDQTSRKKINHI